MLGEPACPGLQRSRGRGVWDLWLVLQTPLPPEVIGASQLAGCAVRYRVSTRRCRSRRCRQYRWWEELGLTSPEPRRPPQSPPLGGTLRLARQLSWSDEPTGLYHYRTKDRLEADVVH